MWKATAGQDLENAFDNAIGIAYGNGRNDELENLANLFSDTALANFQAALLKGLVPGSKAYVDVAWIDKRPIAKVSKNARGAELGDMLLVVDETEASGVRKSRACILEVKQSPSQTIPPVPVTSGKSTRNQFAILSACPTIFGLKATGTNSQYLLENIVTQPYTGHGGAIAQAWYVAAKPPSGSVPVQDPWMAAPAINGVPFVHTLGALFGACARGQPLPNALNNTPIDVGRDFEPGNNLALPPGWDALINAIISVAKLYDLPRHHFPFRLRMSRYLRGRDFASVSLFSFFGLMPETSLIINTLLTGMCLALYVVLVRKTFFPPKPPSVQRRAFPILFFTIIHGE